MDFSLTDDQTELQGLARRILSDRVTHDHLKEVEVGDGLDRSTWDELAAAGLVGIACSEEHGGGGLGFLEVAIVLEEVGRHVAPVPYLPSVMAALAVDRFGCDAQRGAVVPGAADGSVLLTVALSEQANPDPTSPTTAAIDTDGVWTLSGSKSVVPWAVASSTVLVPATTNDGVAVFLVSTDADGVTMKHDTATNSHPVSAITLDGVEAEPLGAPDVRADVLPWLLQHTTAGLCITQAGVCDAALKMTAEYTSSREQFDHPIASFQAVSQRAGDAYIDTLAVNLTAWQAAWRLAEGVPADDEIRIAAFWAADGASRVLHAASHLHGGIGVDIDYPLHRYFTWSRWIELSLGSASEQLVALGASMAAQA